MHIRDSDLNHASGPFDLGKISPTAAKYRKLPSDFPPLTTSNCNPVGNRLITCTRFVGRSRMPALGKPRWRGPITNVCHAAACNDGYDDNSHTGAYYQEPNASN